MTWVLVLYIYAGALAKGDSVTLFAIPGFKTEAACTQAAVRSRPLVGGSLKEIRHVCLPQE